MSKRWRIAWCGWMATVATAAIPSLANAHPACNNDWIIFILLWYLFGAGPLGGGQPQPRPQPVPPNGNGGWVAPNCHCNGNGVPLAPNGNGNGALLRNGAMGAMPGQPNLMRAPGVQQPAKPNGMAGLQQPRQQLPMAPALRGPGNKMKELARGNGALLPLPGKNMPAIGKKPVPGGQPIAGGKPAVGGKPQIGGKPLIGRKP